MNKNSSKTNAKAINKRTKVTTVTKGKKSLAKPIKEIKEITKGKRKLVAPTTKTSIKTIKKTISAVASKVGKQKKPKYLGTMIVDFFDNDIKVAFSKNAQIPTVLMGVFSAALMTSHIRTLAHLKKL